MTCFTELILHLHNNRGYNGNDFFFISSTNVLIGKICSLLNIYVPCINYFDKLLLNYTSHWLFTVLHYNYSKEYLRNATVNLHNVVVIKTCTYISANKMSYTVLFTLNYIYSTSSYYNVKIP